MLNAMGHDRKSSMKKRTEGSKKETRENIFDSLELFREVPAGALRKLEEKCKAENYKAGHIFFRTGEAGRGLYVLEQGRVQTYRDFGSKKLIIAELNAPAVFGEMGCSGPRIYHCIAEATEVSRVRKISSDQMNELREEYPDVTRKLLDLVSERFISTLLELETSSFRDLIPRLAKLLIERAKDEWVRDMTHQEIADHLRVYRESVTSAIGELRKAGMIEVKRKALRIVDRNRLDRAAREGATPSSRG
jgi:CRP-like cAMP-binding protein